MVQVRDRRRQRKVPWREATRETSITARARAMLRFAFQRRTRRNLDEADHQSRTLSLAD